MNPNEKNGESPAAEDLSGTQLAWMKLLGHMTYLSGLLLYALALVISIDIAVRWFSGRPIVGVFEISEVLLIAITFLALAGVQYSGKQLSVDMLSAMAQSRQKALLRILDAVAALLFFGVLLWTSIHDWWEAYHGGFQGSGILKIPVALPLGLVGFGALLMTVTLVLGILRDLRAIALIRTRKTEGQL